MPSSFSGAASVSYTHLDVYKRQKYEITEGSISFKGKDITAESVDRRAKDGMFLSFQEPLEVTGLSVSNFIRSALQQKKGGYVRLWDFKKERCV